MRLRSLVLAALLSTACGGGSDQGPSGSVAGPLCDATPTCGGALSGTTWEIESQCLTLEAPFSQPECESSVHDVQVESTGTVSYLESSPTSGIQHASVSYTLSATEVYSEACLKALKFEGATEEACRGVETLWAGPIAVSCALEDRACRCAFSDKQSYESDEEYEIDGTTLVLHDSGPVDYCRAGNTLTQLVKSPSSESRARLTLKVP